MNNKIKILYRKETWDTYELEIIKVVEVPRSIYTLSCSNCNAPIGGRTTVHLGIGSDFSSNVLCKDCAKMIDSYLESNV